MSTPPPTPFEADVTAVTDGEAPADSAPDRFDEALATGELARVDEPRGSRLDDWWARVLSTPARLRLWYWGGPIAVTLLAAVLRMWNLGSPHQIVFDETFYVKDGWTLWHLGYESTWPEGADESFANGDVDDYNTAAEYVVHPPLGKWIIGAGMALFGAANSFGWRFGVAVVGTLAVLLITLIARRLLWRSTLLGVMAGFLMAIDGNAIVMSRVALLDGIAMFFGLAGFGLILLDRDWSRRRLEDAVRRHPERTWGPVLWWRPWLVAAGIAFGMMGAVKWSGLYMLAAFGVYVVISDMLMRRTLGVSFWVSGGILRQGPVAFVLLVPVAIATYLVSWTGWLVTQGGYYRDWADQPAAAWTGPLAWVPHSLQSLWHYHVAAYGWHVGLHTPHPYQSNPLTWLFMVRPVNMYYEGTDAVAPCGSNECAAQILDVANPLIWWAAALAVLYLVYRLVRYREWRVGLILMGMTGAYLPWLLYLNRTVFQFYSIVFEPYMILALVFTIGIVLGRRTDVWWRRQRGIATVAVYLVVVTLLSVFFWPLWTGESIPLWVWQSHIWLPSWR